MAFADVLFPLVVSAWARGGRGFFTTVVRTYGGDEYRNAAWDQPLGEWECSDALTAAINPTAAYTVQALRNFIMAGRGQLYGFRFRDPQDNTDETHGILALISGSNYQLYKRYTIGSLQFDQIIQKPVSPIVVSGGTVNTINYNTGVVTMTSGTPTSWTGTFDIPVRFAEDIPRLGLDGSGALWSWQSLKLIETRDIS